MSTNESQGKGTSFDGVPTRTTATAVENVAAKNTGQEIVDRIARRRAGILNSGPTPLGKDTPSSLSPDDIRTLNAARRAERARQVEMAKDLAVKKRILNEVRNGGGTIDLDELAINTGPAKLSSGPVPLEERQVASLDDIAISFNRLQQLIDPKPKGVVPPSVQENPVIPVYTENKQNQPLGQADSQFDATGRALDEELNNLRNSVADLYEDPLFVEKINTPKSKGSQKVALLRKIFSDFHKDTAQSARHQMPTDIPTLTEIVHSPINQLNTRNKPVDIRLDIGTPVSPTTKVDVPLDDTEHIDLPLENNQHTGGSNEEAEHTERHVDYQPSSYTPTYPVGLHKEAAPDEHEAVPEEGHPTQSGSSFTLPTPAPLETKKQPVLHRRKVIRGSFFNLSMKKAKAKLYDLIKKISGTDEKEVESRVDESEFVVSNNTLDEFRNDIATPYSGSVIDHVGIARKQEGRNLASPVIPQNTTTPVITKNAVEEDEDDSKEYKKSSWNSMTNAFKKETEPAREARIRALQRSEKRRMEEERKTEEEVRAVWFLRQQRIGRMISGEEALDEEFFSARFDAIDKKTKSKREGVLEKIGKEGMKLLSIFDKGADFIKSKVDTKTKVLAYSGMLAAAGLSLYGAPVFVTGATISVLAAGLRVASASGTYMTARMVLENIYKKAEEKGKAYGNVAKVLLGTGAVIGSAALGTALGMLFEHFFPAEKIAELVQHTTSPGVAAPIPEALQIPSVAPSEPAADVSVIQSGIENSLSSIPLELTEHTVKPGENLWSILGTIMNQANFEGFNALDNHAKDVKILEIVGKIMNDPEAYGIKGGNINHIAKGATLHLAKAFKQ